MPLFGSFFNIAYCTKSFPKSNVFLCKLTYKNYLSVSGIL
uniref:Uncharacterized protein n=1 Tax=Siphoviridae sp. ctTnV63 TaxID=2825523 RepID=A0A8S5NX87_9CAUD|nr:MAG TPA: hypothetical protein [Siphoviridae sp. ctTnV63]